MSSALDDVAAALLPRLPEVAPEPIDGFATGRFARRMLAEGPTRADLDALCRQIDVRRTIADTYADGWRAREGSALAPAEVVAALVTVLLQRAAAVDDDGLGLKCLNSALKALDQHPGVPHAPELRAVASLLVARAARTAGAA